MRPRQQAAHGNRVHFRRGFTVALSNPKTIAFFTAFLPQFVDPTLPAGYQISVMCVVSALLAAASDSCWAIAAGLGRNWFAQPGRTRLLGRASGVTLLGAGLWLSLARRPACRGPRRRRSGELALQVPGELGNRRKVEQLRQVRPARVFPVDAVRGSR